MSDPDNMETSIKDFEPIGDKTVKNMNNEFLIKLSGSFGLKVLYRVHFL